MTDFDHIFSEYSIAIANGKDTTLAFILAHKREIKTAVGFYGFKQFVLNYRIYFDNAGTHRVKKIISDYEKYVLSKTARHKSDLAISHNMLTKIPQIDTELEHKIVNFMFDRMSDTYLKKFKNVSLPHSLKKHLCITHVHDDLLRLKDRNK